MNTLKQTFVLISLLFLFLFVPHDAEAGAIKVWASGDILSVFDINGNFAHIHNTMVGGHGARLVNADVSTNAAISHSKLATPGLIAKTVTLVGATPSTVCAASPCSWNTISGFTFSNVTRGGTGNYSIIFTANRPNANYTVHVTSTAGAAYCSVSGGLAVSGFSLICYSAAGAAADAAFGINIMDDNT